MWAHGLARVDCLTAWSSLRGLRDEPGWHGRAAVRIEAGHSAGDGPYGVCDYRRDVAEVGERVARWLASENLSSGPGWSALHDVIFEEALAANTLLSVNKAQDSHPEDENEGLGE